VIAPSGTPGLREIHHPLLKVRERHTLNLCLLSRLLHQKILSLANLHAPDCKLSPLSLCSGLGIGAELLRNRNVRLSFPGVNTLKPDILIFNEDADIQPIVIHELEMAWPVPEFASADVDEAGRILAVSRDENSPDFDTAVRIIDNFRASHHMPLKYLPNYFAREGREISWVHRRSAY
jgi:hypothetical protein